MIDVVLRAGAATDVGRLRTINQDSYALIPERNLFVVADGMGGHQGGEVASRLAVETLEVAYRDATSESLTDALAVANHRIRNEGDRDAELRGMGTTVVALALVERDADPAAPDGAVTTAHLVIANVGDSRCYLFRDESLTQLTEDHSVVADLVREGRITSKEAEDHPQRNIVTRVLGIYDTVEIDMWPADPVARDRYLLCSDGLFNEVSADQISSVLRRLADPQEAATELVRLANEAGGHDNITALIVDVVADGGLAEAASAALAGDASRLTSDSSPADAIDDPAGFTTASPSNVPDPAAEADGKAPRLSRKERRAQRPPRTRVTWRALGFLLLLVAVIGGAFATIQWYGTSTYFVGFDGDELVIYQGRPDGILWIDPSLQERTGIARADVPERYGPAIAAGNEQSTLAKAREYVDNIRRDIDELTPTPPGGTTTTTGPDSSSTSSTTSTTTAQVN